MTSEGKESFLQPKERLRSPLAAPALRAARLGPDLPSVFLSALSKTTSRKAGTPFRGDTLGREPGSGFLGGLGPAVEAPPCSLEDTLCEGLIPWRWLARTPCREGWTPSEPPRKRVPFVQEGHPGTRDSVSRKVWDEGQKSNFPPSYLGEKCFSRVSRSERQALSPPCLRLCSPPGEGPGTHGDPSGGGGSPTFTSAPVCWP